MSWFIKCLKQYVDFKGRARRKEYWYFVLFYFIIRVISCILDLIFNTQITYPYFNCGWFCTIVGAFPNVNSGFFNIIASVLLILPSLAVVVRRLHDVNKSAWLLVILYVFLGAYLFSFTRYTNNLGLIKTNISIVTCFSFLALGIWLFALMFFDSVPGVNKWGPNPKGVGNEVCAPEVISNVENTYTKPVEADKPKEVETKAEDVVITEPDEKEEKIKKDDDNNII